MLEQNPINRLWGLGEAASWNAGCLNILEQLFKMPAAHLHVIRYFIEDVPHEVGGFKPFTGDVLKIGRTHVGREAGNHFSFPFHNMVFSLHLIERLLRLSVNRRDFINLALKIVQQL